VGSEATLDVAIVGAGAAGTYLADRLRGARPDWNVALFERSDRIGGRLRSIHVDGIAHPIELGGMRYLTSHPLVQSVVTDLSIPTRPFDTWNGPERSFLRGHRASGPTDPGAGRGYSLSDEERGRSAIDLALDAFRRIVPGADTLDHAAWVDRRARATYLGNPITDWSLHDAIASIRSPEGHRFITDAFGYDSGVRPHNAGDAIEYLLGSGDPSGEARVPVHGMDRIPAALAERFEARGGHVKFRHDLERLDVDVDVNGQGVRLEFANGLVEQARRVVLTVPVAALTALVTGSPALAGPAWTELLDAVEGFPATKLYCWYDRPWWRDGTSPPAGIRTTTDLPNRKLFYFDETPGAPAAMLVSYADGRHVEPIAQLARDASNGMEAPAPLLEAMREHLRAIHPDVEVPLPRGSAFMHWGSDSREIGWTYWRAGANSDTVMARALQPDPALPIHLCGESFSRAQAWVQGALETADAVAERLLTG
jgi:monoamine oxidase